MSHQFTSAGMIRQLTPNGGTPVHVEGLAAAVRAANAGNFADAIALMEEILEANDLPIDTLLTLHKSLIDWYGQDGDLPNARRVASNAARIAAAHLGKTAELTLILRHSELYWMCHVGLDDVAARRYPALIRDIDKTLGPTDPLSFVARNNQALPFKRQGKFGAATTLYRDLIADMSTVLEPNDSLLLGTRDNLAECLACDEHYEESTEVYQALLDDLIEELGPGHRRILRLRDDIASNHFCHGNVDYARDLWALLTEDCRKHLGETHVETARQRSLQIALSVVAGDCAATIKWCREFLTYPPPEMSAEDLAEFRELLAEHERHHDAA